MRFLVWGRSLVLAWLCLLLLAYAVETPLLRWTSPVLGTWVATVHLTLDCAVLAAAGWVAARANRSHPMTSAVLFAVTLCFWENLALNVPWLLRLLKNTFQDSRYFDALLASLEVHVLLFGCLLAGAALSRPLPQPISILQEP